MKKISVSDYIVKYVEDSLKVDTIFMLSGGGIMFLTDAIARAKKLKYVCSQNEQSTSMEADAYSKVTGNFSVALVTTGPGATNTITGVVGAWQDSTAMLVISGQAKRHQTIRNSGLKSLRQFGVQEVDILPLIQPVTKYSAIINDPRTIKYHLDKAVYFSRQGRPGPVWLDIPLDVQSALIDPKKLKGFKAPSNVPDRTLKRDVNMLLSMIKKSKRPLFVAGSGVRISKGVELLNLVAKTLNIPVVTPRLGIDLIDSNDRLYVGRPGIKGTRAGNFAIQNSDLLICIGTRLSINVTGHEYTQFAREAKVVVIDIDHVEHKKKTIKIDKVFLHDAKEFLGAMLANNKKFNIKASNDWAKLCLHWKRSYPVNEPNYSVQKPVNTYYFVDTLSKLLLPNDVIIIDSGSSSYVVSQAIQIKKGQRYVASGGLGAMGYAVPASVGASIAKKKGRIICITGDGSLHLNVQELQTIAHNKLPVKIFVFNNKGYASIRTTQHNFFKDRFIGVNKVSGVSIPDTLKIAGLYGIPSIRVSKPSKLKAAISKVLRSKTAYICDIVCDPEQQIVPTVSSKKNPDGTMTSKPLEDMFPFLPRDIFEKEMVIKTLDE